jgi:hypothetical protein
VGGDNSRRLEWLLSLQSTMFQSFEFSLKPMLYEYLKRLSSMQSYHYINILRSLLRDSAVRRATRSEPFELKTLYEFFVKKGLDQEVREALEDMARYGSPFRFRVTRVEPSVLLFSLLLDYCRLKGKFDLKSSVSDGLATTYQIQVALNSGLLREAWENLKNYKPFLFDRIREELDYAKEVGDETPYASLFKRFEDVGVSGSGALDPVLKDLIDITVPFVSCIFPFLGVSADGPEPIVAIRARTREDALMLLEVLALSSHLSAVYAVQLLSGIHAWKCLKLGRSDVGLEKVFERARSASYDPFLPPEAMIRHPLLFVDSMLFKIMNILFEMARRSDLVYEPTGSFEDDLRKLWEMASPIGHKVLLDLYSIKDEDELLKSIERESYELFMKVQKTPYEKISAHFTTVWLEELMEKLIVVEG